MILFEVMVGVFEVDQTKPFSVMAEPPSPNKLHFRVAELGVKGPAIMEFISANSIGTVKLPEVLVTVPAALVALIR